jgi:hypothetical protein
MHSILHLKWTFFLLQKISVFSHYGFIYQKGFLINFYFTAFVSRAKSAKMFFASFKQSRLRKVFFFIHEIFIVKIIDRSKLRTSQSWKKTSNPIENGLARCYKLSGDKKNLLCPSHFECTQVHFFGSDSVLPWQLWTFSAHVWMTYTYVHICLHMYMPNSWIRCSGALTLLCVSKLRQRYIIQVLN